MKDEGISAVTSLLVDQAKLEVLREGQRTAMLWLLKKWMEKRDRQYA